MHSACARSGTHDQGIMSRDAVTPSGTSLDLGDEGSVGHGAVLVTSLCCLTDASREEIDAWLSKVMRLWPDAKAFRFLPVARTQSVLASLVRDIAARVRARGCAVNLVWLRTCESVRRLRQEVSSDVPGPHDVKAVLTCFYRAAALHVRHGCCTHGWTCGEECDCVGDFFAFFDDMFASANCGCGAWPDTLVAGDLGLVQFEALAAWADLQTLFLLAHALESAGLKAWVEAATNSLASQLESVVVHGREATVREPGACSCQVRVE